MCKLYDHAFATRRRSAVTTILLVCVAVALLLVGLALGTRDVPALANAEPPRGPQEAAAVPAAAPFTYFPGQFESQARDVEPHVEAF